MILQISTPHFDYFLKREVGLKISVLLLFSLNIYFVCANRQLVPGTPGNVSTTLQQIQARNQQTIVGYSTLVVLFQFTASSISPFTEWIH